MKVLTAKIVDGQLDVPEGTLEEGASVTLLVSEEAGGFELSEEDKAAMLESVAQAERGEGVEGWNLLEELKS